MDQNKTQLYRVASDITCINCKNRGGVQYYGTIDRITGKIFCAIGPGGTIPWQCMNCGGKGLVDFNGLEGYKLQFLSDDFKNNNSLQTGVDINRGRSEKINLSDTNLPVDNTRITIPEKGQKSLDNNSEVGRAAQKQIHSKILEKSAPLEKNLTCVCGHLEHNHDNKGCNKCPCKIFIER